MLHKLLRVIFIKIYFLYKVYILPICVMYIFLLSGLADDLSNQGYHKNNYYNNDQADTYYDCGKFIRFFPSRTPESSPRSASVPVPRSVSSSSPDTLPDKSDPENVPARSALPLSRYQMPCMNQAALPGRSDSSPSSHI